MKTKQLFNKIQELINHLPDEHDLEFGHWSLDYIEYLTNDDLDYLLTSSLAPNGHYAIISRRLDTDDDTTTFTFHGDLYAEQGFDNLDIDTCIEWLDAEILKY
jgi:hypothetical protein